MNSAGPVEYDPLLSDNQTYYGFVPFVSSGVGATHSKALYTHDNLYAYFPCVYSTAKLQEVPGHLVIPLLIG